MKIILINPPSPFEKEPAMNPPLGLCYISSYAKSCGYTDIRMIDFSLFDYDYYYDTEYLHEIPLDADIYSITCVTPQYKWLHDISSFLKNRNPTAWIVAGGPHPTNMAEECIKDCALDFIVQGEGEFSFIHILSMRKDNFIYGNQIIKSEPYYNIDKFPYPDRSLISMTRYKRRLGHEPATHIVTLRGCNYHCYYCDRSRGADIRYRDIDSVIDEMKSIDVRAFIIYDDIFTLNKIRIKEFCAQMKQNNYLWRCFSRTDKIDGKILKTMRESGLTSITLGVESGDDTILKNINKRTTTEINKKALLACKESGVPVRCSLMYGNPGENRKTLQNTIDLIDETQPEEWNLAVLTPIPGSKFWDHPEKYGIFFDKNYLKKQQYLPCNRFSDTGIGHSYISIDSMTDKEFQKNLIWFVNELERVCPRRRIQDTIQDINI